MKIIVEDNCIKAARITGPEHHFLCLGFSSNPSDVAFEDLSKTASEQVYIERKSLICSIISSSANDLTDCIDRVAFDVRDKPNKFAYEQLIKAILDEAEKINIANLSN